MSILLLRPMRQDEWLIVAKLIKDSTNQWYETNRGFSIFNCPAKEVQLFCEVYETLDPGCCVVAEHTETGNIAGSCFYHPRPTHVSLGIMNVHPDYFGQSVARQLLQHVITLAQQQNKPVRLVSSAMNLDSFSLYSKAGFKPCAVYQDMILEVPKAGVTYDGPLAKRVREATLEDVDGIVALEKQTSGVERGDDYRYFIKNSAGIWHVSVIEGDAGSIEGVLVSVVHTASNMLGPGVMKNDEQAIALIAYELNQHCGRSPVWLVPSDRPPLVQQMYQWGAKNCELHVAQVHGEAKMVSGVVMPTFMPETG